MNTDINDTICGISTPPGKGGIAVIRISGSRAHEMLKAVFLPVSEDDLTERMLCYGHVKDGMEKIDEAMAVIFSAPHTYTREDMAELHVHGGALHAKKALALLIQHGARAAAPGEFTKRAFLNGRIDLAQAEALMDFIGAATELASKSALLQMEGELSNRIRGLMDGVANCIAKIEAELDFPEDLIDEDLSRTLEGDIGRLRMNTEAILVSANRGRIIREGFSVAIVGRPNVGKSSLLNALIGRDRAIVTDIPGTTRDVIEECVDIEGLLVRFGDTAGLRRETGTIESIGMERAKKYLEESDIALFVIDGADEWTSEDDAVCTMLKGRKAIALINKSDAPQKIRSDLVAAKMPEDVLILSCSAQDGRGIEAIRTAIAREALGAGLEGESGIITNIRHIDALNRARTALENALNALKEGLSADMACIDLREAWHALGEITGDTLDERIIDRIFETFCLGK